MATITVNYKSCVTGSPSRTENPTKNNNNLCIISIKYYINQNNVVICTVLGGLMFLEHARL